MMWDINTFVREYHKISCENGRWLDEEGDLEPRKFVEIHACVSDAFRESESGGNGGSEEVCRLLGRTALKILDLMEWKGGLADWEAVNEATEQVKNEYKQDVHFADVVNQTHMLVAMAIGDKEVVMLGTAAATILGWIARFGHDVWALLWDCFEDEYV